MPNQHKPPPPSEVIKPWVEYYWDLGKSDVAITSLLRDHYDTEEYGCSVWTLRRLRQSWGMKGVRQQKHTFESIAAAVQEIRERFPTQGARQMVIDLRRDYQIRVPEQLIGEYLRQTEPEAVRARFGRRFKRKRFWAAGIHDIVAMDQHDKWRRFGLFLHLGIEPYAGRLWWLKIWWTNRNPHLITKYYLDSARRVGGVPLVTQSDPGTENFGVANCHTTIRHRLDPSLSDTLQHRWMRNKANVKPEIAWGLLRRTWSRGFEDTLDYGFNNGLYNPDNTLEKLAFFWLAIPWLQAELDSYMDKFNSSPRRADKNKILPRGIPDLITAKPERYGTLDFKVIVPEALFDEMEQEWAPQDLPVFQLVPPVFGEIANTLYNALGRPEVSSKSFWDVYCSMMDGLQGLADMPDFSDAPQSRSRDDAGEGGIEEVPLLPNLRDLRHGFEAHGPAGFYYMGGLENPPLPPAVKGGADEPEPEQEQEQDAGGDDAESSDSGDGRVYAVFSDWSSSEGEDEA